MGGTPYQQPVGMPQAMRNPIPLPELFKSSLVHFDGKNPGGDQVQSGLMGKDAFCLGLSAL